MKNVVVVGFDINIHQHVLFILIAQFMNHHVFTYFKYSQNVTGITQDVMDMDNWFVFL